MKIIWKNDYLEFGLILLDRTDKNIQYKVVNGNKEIGKLTINKPFHTLPYRKNEVILR